MSKVRTADGLRMEISEDCVGSAQCVALAPQVFRLGTDGYATLTEELLTAEGIERAREAEDVCPMGAIRVTDDV